MKRQNESKSILKSKTVWTVIITIGVTIAQSQGIDLPEWLVPSLLSAGLIFDRTSKKEIK